MNGKKSRIAVILSILFALAAIAAVALVIYKKICKKKLQAEEETDLLESDEETENSEVEEDA